MTINELIHNMKSNTKIVFVSENYRTNNKFSSCHTEQQWKEYFPDDKFIFDYVNQVVRKKDD